MPIITMIIEDLRLYRIEVEVGDDELVDPDPESACFLTDAAKDRIMLGVEDGVIDIGCDTDSRYEYIWASAEQIRE